MYMVVRSDDALQAEDSSVDIEFCCTEVVDATVDVRLFAAGTDSTVRQTETVGGDVQCCGGHCPLEGVVVVWRSGGDDDVSVT